jgi:hypothetical protein
MSEYQLFIRPYSGSSPYQVKGMSSVCPSGTGQELDRNFTGTG